MELALVPASWKGMNMNSNHPALRAALAAVNETLAAKAGADAGAAAMVAALAIALRSDYAFTAPAKGQEPALRFTIRDYVAALAVDARAKSGRMTAAVLSDFCPGLDGERMKVAAALLSRNLRIARFVAQWECGIGEMQIASATGGNRKVIALTLPLSALCSEPGDDAPGFMVKSWLQHKDALTPVLPRNGLQFSRSVKDAKGKASTHGFAHNWATLSKRAAEWAEQQGLSKPRGSKAKAVEIDWKAVQSAVEALAKPVTEGSAFLTPEQERAASTIALRIAKALEANRKLKEGGEQATA